MSRCLTDGNEAVAWGAVNAGCRFFAGYPITPATTILNTMLQLLPPIGGICVQGEDEIASIGYCLGASMAGMKAMTATSGPGISLYSEQISFAIACEIPVVIVDVQRLGPSTGSATRGADGDIQFLRWGSSGGFPVIVLAPTNVADCYHLTIKAFELAEEFQCPVFIASDKEIAMTKESAEIDFQIPEKPPALRFPSVGDQVLVRKTSSTHGPDNYITTDPEVISRTQEQLKNKLLSAIEHFTIYEEIIEPGSDTLIICYGVTARAAKAAAANLKAKQTPISLLILKTLWPVPEMLIREKAAGFEHIMVIEMNLGQYVREIRRVLGRNIKFFGQMNGRLITPGQIEAWLLHQG